MRLRREVPGQLERTLGHWDAWLKAQLMFSSNPSVAEKNAERNRKTHMINRWLKGWYHGWNVGFFNQGMVHMAPGLLEADGVLLSKREKRNLAHELSDLIERA